MSIFKEFKKFAIRWNVVDLAVAVIIGGAFGKIVTSIVEDIIMPLIAKVIWDIDFSNLYLFLWNEKISSTATLAEAKKLWPVLAYWNFITIVINFIIVAISIFIVVKILNKAKETINLEEEKKDEPKKPSQEDILLEIRDLLKNKTKI